MNEVTQVLDALARGDACAADRLLPLVYEELRTLAANDWPKSNRGRRYRLPPWCMKPICV
jgi:hypothetical protein